MEPLQIIVEQLRDGAAALLAHLPQVMFALVVLLVTWAVSRVTGALSVKLLSRWRMRRSLVDVVDKLFSITIWLGGLMLAATIAFPTLTPGKIVTAIGLGSIAIGFAFKDIFENFIAGVLILFREPFRLQDFIQCEDLEGYVEEITIRDTHIRQTDGQRVVIPNAMLFKNPVIVRTDREIRRTTITCGVAYGEDVTQSRTVIQEAVEGLDSVRKDEGVQVFAQAFGSSSIDFEVTWWTGSRPVDIRRSRDEVVAAVKAALDQAGIEIPFPYRTLTFKEPLTVQRGRFAETDEGLDD